MSVFTSEVTVGNEVTVDGSSHVQPVSGPLTDVQLRAAVVPVTVANFPATQPISGSVSVSNFPATQPVSGPLTDTQLRATPVPISGTVSTAPSTSASATITRVATSAVSVLVAAANASRKRIIITTETGTSNYLAFALTASSTTYTYLLGSTTVLEIVGYTGPIALIRASGTGNVQVTELV